MKRNRRWRSPNRDMLKGIAAAAMLLDHIAWQFLAFASPLAQLFHTVGRVTLPIMCFFIAEGYTHTRSKKQYALRLLLFALLSQIPFAMFQGNRWDEPPLNVLFTLLLCFLAVLASDKLQNTALRGLAVLGCAAASWWCDWPVTAVLFTLAFWAYREDAGKRAAAFSAAAAYYFCSGLASRLVNGDGVAASLLSCLYMLGVFLALALLACYRGQKGRFFENGLGRWFFYLFYPAHLLLLELC